MTALAEHCFYCFEVLEAHLAAGGRKNVKPPKAPDALLDQDQDVPLFVTWNSKRGNRWALRGCIGTFAPQPVIAGLARYAYISAFEDTRFNPVASAELPNLQCCVSLLTDFEEIVDPLDWEVGKHGIMIQFSVRGRKFSGTYLPNVASDQRWGQKTTLSELLLKAGHRGGLTPEVLKTLHVTRYQSAKASATYAELLDWKTKCREKKEEEEEDAE